MKMHAFELDWTAKMMDAVIPPGVEQSIAKAASETTAVKIMEEMIKYTPFVTGFSLRAAIWFVEILGPIYTGKLRRFSKLEPAAREQVLRDIYKSKIYFVRQMVLLVKMTACFGWGADPEIRKGIGVTDPPKFVKRGGN